MIERDPKNKDVLFPYLNGKDLNTHPEQKPSRWVINFFDWPEDKARAYSEPYRIVLEKVKPERQAKKPNGEFKQRKPLPQRWWQYAEKRPALYHAIGRGAPYESHPEGWVSSVKPLQKVLVNARVAKYFNPTFVQNNLVFHEKIVVLTAQSYAHLALLNSSLLQGWIWKQSSRMKLDLNFSPSDAYETLPFPNVEGEENLEALGQQYDELRKKIFAKYQIGSTALHNKFHDADEYAPEIRELRDLQVKIDVETRRVYQWNDLELTHDFYEMEYLAENDCLRYTVSEHARLEVLRRLSRLNKERYEEEVKQGLHAKKKPKRKATTKKKTKAKVYEIPAYQERELPKVAEPSQIDFLGDTEEPTEKSTGHQWGSNPIDQILAWLEAHPGWHTKESILAGCCVDSTSWADSVTELLNEKFVETRDKGAVPQFRAAQS